MRSLFGASLFLFAAFGLQATTVTFGSDVLGTIETNNYDGVNVVTTPAPQWHSPIGTSEWESIQPNSLDPVIRNGTIVDFSFSFSLPGTPTGGDVTVMVDDSADVLLNGITLVDNLNSARGTFCAVSLPNCVTPLTLNIAGDLRSDVNTLQVYDSQDNLQQFGVDVYGTASSIPSATPEPAGLAALGLTLLGAGCYRRFRVPSRSFPNTGIKA